MSHRPGSTLSTAIMFIFFAPSPGALDSAELSTFCLSLTPLFITEVEDGGPPQLGLLLSGVVFSLCSTSTDILLCTTSRRGDTIDTATNGWIAVLLKDSWQQMAHKSHCTCKLGLYVVEVLRAQSYINLLTKHYS